MPFDNRMRLPINVAINQWHTAGLYFSVYILILTCYYLCCTAYDAIT